MSLTHEPADADAEASATLEALERELADARARLRETAASGRADAAELHRVRRELAALRRRRTVRMALRISAVARQTVDLARRVAGLPRRIYRAIRRRVRERRRQWGRRASPAAEAALLATIRRDIAPSEVVHGPLVSIVILNRDGRDHLERCLAAIATTAYRDVEVIVVDNASGDGSPEFAEGFAMPFPVTVVRNAENRSFSEANGQGVAIAAGDLICFLNNDVDPITEHWLGYLVETITATDAAAVGARLIYPRQRRGRRAGSTFADLSLQHMGVDFDRTGGIPLPRVMGPGEDPSQPGAVEVTDRPALTAACLLVRRRAFEDAGGFASEYDYGIEDVDLCLRLRAAGGRLVYDGRATLWHHESATRATDRARYKARVNANRSAYVDAWGPRIFRDALLDAIGGDRRFSDAPFHVAITLTSLDPGAGYGDWYTGHELGDALERIGWRVSYCERARDGWYEPDPAVEAVIVLLDACDIRRLPRTLVSMAWIRNWPERWLDRPWFDDFDLVFASSERIVAMVHEASSKVATLLPIATNPDRFDVAEPRADLAADVMFAGSVWGEPRDVVDALPALAERGLSVRVFGRGWDGVPGFERLRQGALAYDELPRAYASARIVIDDAASSTKSCGSVNSRVFDALATGAIVVSNGAVGVHTVFGDDFPTWSDRASLVELVESILRDPAPAMAQAQAYRAQVRAGHTYAIRATTIRDALVAWATATRYGLRVGAPSWEVAPGWGDYHFARALQRSLERAGHPARLHMLPDWGTAVAAREDVTVHLFGLSEAPTRKSQVNLLWQISHPDLATPELYQRYDHVLVASDPFAARMAPLVGVPVTPLHQATDPERFRPEPGGPRHELLYVANSRRVRRRIVADLAGTGHDLAVYGRGWTPDLLEPRFLRGESIANADLGRYYGSAAIVLNDHWDDMRDEGFISNRLYDALASGGFVISDQVEGIAEEFDGAVPTYRLRDELDPLINRYLADATERRRLAERGRRVVLERHTVAARVRSIEAIAGPIVAGRPDRIVAEPAGMPIHA